MRTRTTAWRCAALWCVTIAGPAVVGAQSSAAPAYVPTESAPRPTELVAVVIGGRSCGPCNAPEYKRAIREALPMLAKQAADAGQGFVAIGVGMDWNVDTAHAYFATLATFDELIIGRNWYNTGTYTYLWRDSSAVTGVPQVILVRRRNPSPPSGRVAVSTDSVIARLAGTEVIAAWAARGAPSSP